MYRGAPVIPVESNDLSAAQGSPVPVFFIKSDISPPVFNNPPFPKQVTMRKGKSKRQQKYSRRMWTDDEDKAISILVNAHGVRRWAYVAKELHRLFNISGRSGKQCRER
eukprot:TRINITY_DN4987_c0_g3_i2.p4 TRINITY_DN4987_c0_g3~~TRINITY_DN4987_c0_g3_i2.p4  ORF type:complete len:109 (-),score=17.41 TRINITY_DN4987_c0_g3_i2:634-960(-)